MFKTISQQLTELSEQTYAAYLTAAESARKESAWMLWCFYENNLSEIKRYIVRYMMESSVTDELVYNPRDKCYDNIGSGGFGLFSRETTRIIPKNHFNLTGKVLDLIATLYNGDVDRWLVNRHGEIDEKQTKLLQDLYEDAEMETAAQEFYEKALFFNTVLVSPVWRRGSMQIDTYTPNFLTVRTDPDDYLSLRALWLDKEVESEDAAVYWDDRSHYIELRTGERIPVGNNTDMKNIYGALPFEVLRIKKGSDFWGEGQADLVENNIWYDIRENNNIFVEMFQGLGVGLGINLGQRDEIQLKPNTIINVENVREGKVQPDLRFASTNAPLSELRESANDYYKKIGNSRGISGQAFSNEIITTSGVAKAYDNQELVNKRTKHRTVLKRFEKRFYEKFRMVYNYHARQENLPLLKEGLKLHVDFIEPQKLITQDEELKRWDFELKNGLASPIDYLIYRNPDLTTEEAEKQLSEIRRHTL
jgi:hypothetical protein